METGFSESLLSLTVMLITAIDFSAGYVNLADIDCGQQLIKVNPKLRETRIAGGREAYHGEFPWIVSLQYNTGSTSHFCGGFLVNRSTIISAAHCFTSGISKDRINVVIGEHIIDEIERPTDAKIYQIASINVHPDYTISEATKNDIALVHLKKHVDWTPYVQPACLSNNDDDLAEGKSSQVAGWGKVSESSGTAATLMTVEANIVSLSTCESEYEWKPSVNQFCAGHKSKNKGACKGDSGSPLMTRNTGQDAMNVVGIHTGGHGCGLGMLPGVYTKISSYISWVQTNVA